MRPVPLALALLAPIVFVPAVSAQDQGAQDQGAREQEALRPPQAVSSPPVFDMVASDRETAWRINRQTGEVVVCRIDTTSSLETVRARCAAAAIDTGPQQSMTPPGGVGGSRP